MSAHRASIIWRARKTSPRLRMDAKECVSSRTHFVMDCLEKLATKAELLDGFASGDFLA
jgi:hypothetical protein